MKASTLKRFFRLENFPEHLTLHRMDCLAAHRNLEIWNFGANDTNPCQRRPSADTADHWARVDCGGLHARACVQRSASDG